MQPLSIFVSSTCYDLRALREHLRSEIATWGHDPVLSEYPSFPVSPDLTTVDNCRKVVRERADVFVLVVGGKRGSLDPVTNRSVVNAEYREARFVGIDCIIFVERQVWDLLPHFKRNPEADFSSTVDYPDVFRFIDEITESTKWIFPFTRTDEILSTLRTQLSIRFRDLLTRARSNRLTILPEFVGESEVIARIAVDKDRLWEYRLACELLKDRMHRLDLKFSEVRSGFAVRRTKFLAGRDTINFIQDLLKDLTTIIEASVKILHEQLVPAFGPPGTPGDAGQIKRACDNLYSIFFSLYEWEMDVRFVRPHEVFEGIFSKMHGWSEELLSEFHRLPRELDDLLSKPDLTGQYSINLVIVAPKGIEAFTAEFEKMANDPRVIAAVTSGG
jgi:Domain of unknown function (DUF4062)